MEHYEKTTGVVIVYQSLQWTEVTKRLLSGDSPDILLASSGALTDLGIDDFMLPLDRFLSLESTQVSKIPPNLFLRDPNNKTVYAVPYEIVIANVKMYNRNMFAKSGLDQDSPPVYWGDLHQVSAKMTMRADNQVRQLGFDSFDWAKSFVNFLSEAGGSLFSDDYRQVTFHSPVGMDAIRCTAELYKLTYPDRSAPDVRKQWPGFKSPLLDFVEGRTAIFDASLPISYVLSSAE